MYKNLAFAASVSRQNLINQAAIRGDIESVKFLFEIDENLKFKAQPFIEAAERGHINIVKLFFINMNPDAINQALRVAIIGGQNEVVRFLLLELNDKEAKNLALLYAVDYDRSEIVTILINAGVSPDTRYRTLLPKSPLEYTVIHRVFRDRTFGSAIALIRGGADLSSLTPFKMAKLGECILDMNNQVLEKLMPGSDEKRIVDRKRALHKTMSEHEMPKENISILDAIKKVKRSDINNFTLGHSFNEVSKAITTFCN